MGQDPASHQHLLNWSLLGFLLKLVHVFLWFTTAHVQAKGEVSSHCIWSSNSSSPNLSKLQTQIYNFLLDTSTRICQVHSKRSYWNQIRHCPKTKNKILNLLLSTVPQPFITKHQYPSFHCTFSLHVLYCTHPHRHSHHPSLLLNTRQASMTPTLSPQGSLHLDHLPNSILPPHLQLRKSYSPLKAHFRWSLLPSHLSCLLQQGITSPSAECRNYSF